MNLTDCYQLLGLQADASPAEIKAAYRRLARRLHPDVNPGNLQAQEQFIRVTDAYRRLLSVTAISAPPSAKASPQATQAPPSPRSDPPQVSVTRKPTAAAAAASAPELSLVDRHFKQSVYEQLQQLLKSKRFPRAVTLMDGLAQRFPHDRDVQQWHGIVYRQWGLHLIQTRELEKARIYLKKALRLDPHNRRLWADVEQDFVKLEQALKTRR